MTEIIDSTAKKSVAKKESSFIDVVVVRSIGVKGCTHNGIPDMAGPGTEVSLPREDAIKLQDVGAVKVKI